MKIFDLINKVNYYKTLTTTTIHNDEIMCEITNGQTHGLVGHVTWAYRGQAQQRHSVVCDRTDGETTLRVLHVVGIFFGQKTYQCYYLIW